MKKALFVSLLALVLAAGPALAIQPGSWECMGYTVTVTADDPEDPNASGTLVITRDDDYATVAVEGTYERVGDRRPVTFVEIWGTITTPDGVIEVDRDFTFKNGPRKAVWYTVVSWIESQIAN